MSDEVMVLRALSLFEHLTGGRLAEVAQLCSA